MIFDWRFFFALIHRGLYNQAYLVRIKILGSKELKSFSPLQEREKRLKGKPLRIANLQEMLGTSFKHFKLLNKNEKKKKSFNRKKA